MAKALVAAPLLATCVGAVHLQVRAHKSSNATSLGMSSAHDVRGDQEKCSQACGDNVDVSCYTMCEVDMYECFDTNTPPGGEPIETCQKSVLEKYADFEKMWAAASVFLSKASGHNERCKKTCGNDSYCISACEVEMYECVDVHTPQNEQGIGPCQDEVEAKFAKTVSFLLAHNDLKERGYSMCGNCGVDAMCRSACETEMYECYDANTPRSEDKIKSCQDEVQNKYKSQVEFFVALQQTIAQRKHGKHVVGTTLWKKMQGSCDEACGPNPESKCITDCEVKIVACHDDNTPRSEDKIGQCEKEVLAKIEKK
eukprot:TRINITY_DN53068_c0_g1_i1.p1 TRINITY_DN53068_c0_g1~~TRINITY_DN53068_c0_g1_i1.p1  ORF type:complete len:312 (+),score=82.55 TRINITY_DN53068_c0_g1_i1:122-1057(+)